MNSKGHHITTIVCSDKLNGLQLEPGERIVTAKVNDLALAPGEYLIDVLLSPMLDAPSCDAVFDYPLLSVRNKNEVIHGLSRSWGAVYCRSVVWEVEEAAQGSVNVKALTSR